MKHEDNTVSSSGTLKTANRIKNSSLDTNKLNGVWVSTSYINDLNKYHSITETEKKTKCIISVFIRDTFIEGLEFYQQMPWMGVISKNKIEFNEKKYYAYFVNKNNELYINDTLSPYSFKKIYDAKWKVSEFGMSEFGRQYLYTYLFLGHFKFIDSYSNNIYDITFCGNNELKGFLNYGNYYPSSYMDNDIILIRNKKNSSTLSYIFKFCETGFILEEVKEFGWNDEPLVKTGRIFNLEKQ